MKRILALSLIAGTAVHADAPKAREAAEPKAASHSSSSKICIYDPELLASQSEEWRSLVLEVDKKYQKEAEVIKKDESKFQEDVKTFNSKFAVLSESSREAEAERLERRKADLEHKAKRMVDDYQNERQKVNVRFYKKLEEGIESFLSAQPNLEIAVPKTPGVFLKKGVADHTTAIAGHMNREYLARTKVAAAPTPVTVAKN